MDLPYTLDNDTTLAGSNLLHEHPQIAIPYMTVLILGSVIGTMGNVMVIGAVFINKHLNTAGNLFIVNLACADLCVTAFVDPFSVLGVIRGEVWFVPRYALCEVVACVCLTSCFCSLLTIGAISLNRFVHICHHEFYARFYTNRNTILMCLGLWVVSFLMEMPNFIGWGDHGFDRKTQSCIWDRTADFSYSVFFSLAGVAFPVTLIAICYAMIFLYARGRSQHNAQTGDTAATKREHESVHLARTLFIVFVVFTVCWTPYAIAVAVDKHDKWPLEVHFFTLLLAHLNSSLNCMLYGLTNRHFRNGYSRLLKLDKWPVKCAGVANMTAMTDLEESNILRTEIEIEEKVNGSEICHDRSV